MIAPAKLVAQQVDLPLPGLDPITVAPRVRVSSVQARKVQMIQIAPGKFRPHSPDEIPPEVVITDVIQDNDGTYHLAPRDWEHMTRVTSKLCQLMGLGKSSMTLRRLINSGFVDGARIAPQFYLVNLTSWTNHVKRCAEDPFFWDEPKRRKAYRETI